MLSGSTYPMSVANRFCKQRAGATSLLQLSTRMSVKPGNHCLPLHEQVPDVEVIWDNIKDIRTKGQDNFHVCIPSAAKIQVGLACDKAV